MALGTWLKTFMTAQTSGAAAVVVAPLATAAELRVGSQSAPRFLTPQLLSALVSSSGTTAARPTDATVGYIYFDTTLGKPVFLKTAPSTWVDSTGTAA